MSEIVPIRNGGAVTQYEPEKGLKEISVAEAAEKHYARAKDATRLLKAMELKLKAIRQFVLWWDPPEGVRKGGNPNLNRRSTATVVAGQNGMPERSTIERWRDRTKDEAAFAKALVDAKHRAQRIGDLENANTVRGTEGTGEFERYTPAQYIAAARRVLGEIDLDPASCEVAQGIVKAVQYFTAKDDGLKQEWHGRVWLNPPYAQPLIAQFVSKLIAERKAGRDSSQCPCRTLSCAALSGGEGLMDALRPVFGARCVFHCSVGLEPGAAVRTRSTSFSVVAE